MRWRPGASRSAEKDWCRHLSPSPEYTYTGAAAQGAAEAGRRATARSKLGTLRRAIDHRYDATLRLVTASVTHPHQQGGAPGPAAADGASGLRDPRQTGDRGRGGRSLPPRPAPHLRGRPPRPRRGHRHGAEARRARRREHHGPLRPARGRGPPGGGGPPPRPLRAAATGLIPGQRTRLRVRRLPVRKRRMPTTPKGHRHPLVQSRSRVRHLAAPRLRRRRPTPERAVRLVRLHPVTGIPEGVSAAGALARR